MSMSSQLFKGFQKVQILASRNFGLAAPALQKVSDPIQQLFLDKVREYKGKSGSDGKLVDASAELKRELKQEMEKLAKQYGGNEGADMTKFPEFKFSDPKIDPINSE